MYQQHLIKHTSNSGSRISKLSIVREKKSQVIPAQAMKGKRGYRAPPINLSTREASGQLQVLAALLLASIE